MTQTKKNKEPAKVSKTSPSAFSKAFDKALDAGKSTTAVGSYLLVIFLLITHIYYNVHSQNAIERSKNPTWENAIFQTIEFVDQKISDLRFRFRGENPVPDNVALLTVDDRSLEVIGRWPWSREKIAYVLDEIFKYNAKALGFDIIFSEPQEDLTLETLNRIESKLGKLPENLDPIFQEERKRGHPDDVLTKSIEKNRDKIVLGVFGSEESHDQNEPYQDYCRNEAFRRVNADQFVKLNTSFIVDDTADPFVDLDFGNLFNPIFEHIDTSRRFHFLNTEFKNKEITDLTEAELRKLNYLISNELMSYCDRWLLTSSRGNAGHFDEYLYPNSSDKSEVENALKIKELLLSVLRKSPLFADLADEETIAEFKKLSLPLPIPQRGKWTINIDKIQSASDYSSSFNAEQDADGTIRRASMFFRTGNKIGTSYIPSLPLETFLVGNKYRADIEIGLDPKNPDHKVIRRFNILDTNTDPETILSSIPIDPLGGVKINYYGGSYMIPHVPAVELFNNKETMIITKKEINPMSGKWEPKDIEVNKAEFIKDKSFIFGATAVGIYDLRVTPFEKNYPGPETHTTALANLVENRFLRTPPTENIQMLWGLVIFGAALIFGISHSPAIPGFFITFGSLVVLFLTDQYFFKKGIVFTSALPGLLIVLLYVVLFFYKYLTEERKKKYLKSTFSKYVSPAIVDEILKHPDNINLGGRKVGMSVFFSDIRGFTTLSEKLDPEDLSDVLNRYLTPMTNLVFANKGTLDKYMGDAVMAFFGAPVYFPDHAVHACRCALQSISKLNELQKEFKVIFVEKGMPDATIDIGIGLNTGDMSVGNMGSDIVRSYTVMGDAVNLASRLEGINKEYGTRIVISEFTQKLVKDQFTTRELDWVRVKGKTEPIRIFELISEGPHTDPSVGKMLEAFNFAFEAYHKKDFSLALENFRKCLEILPGDPPSELYLERCTDYLETPPPENWDGVYIMKTK